MTQSSCKRYTKSRSHPGTKLAPVRFVHVNTPLHVIRGRQTNSQLIVSGVTSRRDQKYKGRLIASKIDHSELIFTSLIRISAFNPKFKHHLTLATLRVALVRRANVFV